MAHVCLSGRTRPTTHNHERQKTTMANNSKIQNDERLEGGAVNQEAFESAIRENLSPEGVAMTIAFLRTAGYFRSDDPASERALRQVAWLADTLIEMLGVEEYNRILEDLGL